MYLNVRIGIGIFLGVCFMVMPSFSDDVSAQAHFYGEVKENGGGERKFVVIKSTTNRNEQNIGDYWIGEDLAAGFRISGADVDIDYRDEYNRSHQSIPDIALFMRGYTEFRPPFSAKCTVLYAYYPMAYYRTSGRKALYKTEQPADANLDDDWRNYDLIAVASKSYARKLTEHGVAALYVPQFTNPERFYPAPDEKLKTDILFVGSNWHDRTSLRYALESGFSVAVYGYNWNGVIPAEMYKGSYIANSDLARYYSSAKIVLNDHRPDMKVFGFVNNRIYDATAAGALVISDYMPEIESEYGDSVPMYKDKQELVDLLTYYLTHDEERQKLATKAREITLRKFTDSIVAKRILEAAGSFCPVY